ncbi:MAG: FG-GAP repeat domain-containing protein [Planctomycetota bacterium]|jgi:hypothetical protein
MNALMILLALLFPAAGTPKAPELSEGMMIQAAGEAIDVQIGHLVPAVADWNNDGKKDLIIGQFAYGKIRLYLNKGTDRSPRFDKFEFMTAGGKEISLEAG